MSKNTNLDSAVRNLFKSSPFDRLISESLESIHGNSNGTVFGNFQDGSKICLDESSTILNSGKKLLESVVGPHTRDNSFLEMDVEVNGEGFCLSLIGPPTSDGWSWSVVRREVIKSEARRNIAVCVDL